MSISEDIKVDLAVRLKAGRGLPTQLTLDSLADLYQVSYTPIRTAVASLIDEGLLTKGPNRRLMIGDRIREHATDEKRPSEERAPLSLPRQDLFEVITDDLLRLSLTGKSIYLREEVTAEKYEISRSAIRNILHRLAGEGILDHIPRRGWRLRPFRQDDLKSFVEVREVLELKALDLARPRLDVSELQRILDANVYPTSAEDSPRIDESLHSYLIKTASNAYIQDFFERQGRYFKLLFQWEDHDQATAIETVRQHREILESLLNEDWVGARQALSHHILNNHPILTQIVEEIEKRHEQPQARGSRQKELQ